jgi:hypothetical protein
LEHLNRSAEAWFRDKDLLKERFAMKAESELKERDRERQGERQRERETKRDGQREKEREREKRETERDREKQREREGSREREQQVREQQEGKEQERAQQVRELKLPSSNRSPGLLFATPVSPPKRTAKKRIAYDPMEDGLYFSSSLEPPLKRPRLLSICLSLITCSTLLTIIPASYLPLEQPLLLQQPFEHSRVRNTDERETREGGKREKTAKREIRGERDRQNDRKRDHHRNQTFFLMIGKEIRSLSKLIIPDER